jgi:hypothetical protein
MDAKQKKYLFIGGGVLLVLIYLYVRAKGAAASQTAQAVYPNISGPGTDLSSSSPFQDVIHALNQSEQGLAAINANQILSLGSNFSLLGAESWLSCIPPAGGRPDAMCIKAKGGVFGPGGQNVSNVKTQHILDTIYTGPYAKCKKADGSYDLTCVGALISGVTQIPTVTA